MINYNGNYKFIKNGLATTLLAVLAVGCAATSVIEEGPASAELVPMARPSLELNERVVQMDKIGGKEIHYDITQINDDDTHTGLSSNGCGWTSMNDLVGPALSWENCPGSSEWSSGENRNMKKRVNCGHWLLATRCLIRLTNTMLRGKIKAEEHASVTLKRSLALQ